MHCWVILISDLFRRPAIQQVQSGNEWIWCDQIRLVVPNTQLSASASCVTGWLHLPLPEPLSQQVWSPELLFPYLEIRDFKPYLKFWTSIVSNKIARYWRYMLEFTQEVDKQIKKKTEKNVLSKFWRQECPNTNGSTKKRENKNTAYHPVAAYISRAGQNV